MSIVLDDKPAVRRESDREADVVLHYARDGSLVRMDVSPSTRRKGPRDVSHEAVFMSLRNAAERLGSHPSTVRRAAVKGTLRALPIGSQWVTTPEWLEEYKRKRRKPGRPRKTA